MKKKRMRMRTRTGANLIVKVEQEACLETKIRAMKTGRKVKTVRVVRLRRRSVARRTSLSLRLACSSLADTVMLTLTFSKAYMTTASFTMVD